MQHVRSGLGLLATKLFVLVGHEGGPPDLSKHIKRAHDMARELSEHLEEGTLIEAMRLLDLVDTFAGVAEHLQQLAGHHEHDTHFAMHLSHVVSEGRDVRKLVLEFSSTTKPVDTQ